MRILKRNRRVDVMFSCAEYGVNNELLIEKMRAAHIHIQRESKKMN